MPDEKNKALETEIQNLKRRIQILESQNARLLTAMDNLTDCVGICRAIRDAHGQIVDFVVEYVNEAACNANKTSELEALSKRYTEHHSWSKGSHFFKELCQVVETGTPLIKESYITHPHHRKMSTYYIKVAKNEDGYIAVWRNVTEQEMIETNLYREYGLRTEVEAKAQQMKAILDNMLEAVFILDPDCNILLWNKAARDALIKWGFDANLDNINILKDLNITYFSQGSMLEISQRPAERVLRGEDYVDYQMEVLLSTGEKYAVSFNGVPVYNENGELEFGLVTMVDITKRREAEDQITYQNAILSGINKIFEKALSNSGKQEVGNICLNVAMEVTNSPTGFVIVFHQDDSYSVVSKYPELEIHQLTPDIGERHLSGALRLLGVSVPALRQGKPLYINNLPGPVEHAADMPVGHPHLQSFLGLPLIHEGENIGMIGLGNREGGYSGEHLKAIEPLARAIVQAFLRQSMERELRDSEERYRILAEKLRDVDLPMAEDRFSKVFHGSPIMMILATVQEGVILDVNQAFCSGLGYTREELIGETSKKMNIWADYKTRLEMEDLLLMNNKLENVEFDFCTKAGEVRNGLLWSQVVYFDDTPCHVSCLLDVTDKIRIEKEMFRMDRLNLIGEVAASIGHEIRNPITAVRGFLQLLSCDDESAENQVHYQLMLEEIDRANAIITEFLSMARDKAINLLPQSLNNIISAIKPIVQAEGLMSEKGLVLDLGLPARVFLDESETRQLILNLIRNGFEAMEAGGTITLGTEVSKEHVILFVKDQGSGIDPNYIKKIGTPFTTTKEGGTGLGLAICYSIAERHGATIDFETGPGGTTFRVSFPRIVEQVERF